MSEPLPATPAIPLSRDRIWVDGCFDFTHHGHAGAMLQAKRLGTYLCVGVHSDAAITHNKGPPVMTLPERMLAVSACRWSDLAVPSAPYVTDPLWLDHFGCHSVVHGDDVTTDASGEDCYRIVKSMDRFLVVPRTPGISTTDLVGRMLLCTKTHHIPRGNFKASIGADGLDRLRNYASDSRGTVGAGPPVLLYDSIATTTTTAEPLIPGILPTAGKKVIYVDGGFDLFTPGHVEFLRLVREAQDGDVYLITGVHDDADINRHKGLNYPIMSMFERGLCVLQCKYVDAVVLGAPFAADERFLDEGLKANFGEVEEVWHGPTPLVQEGEVDAYEVVKRRGLYREVGEHEWAGVNAREIVGRILRQRDVYEERQRKKGVKATVEDTLVN